MQVVRCIAWSCVLFCSQFCCGFQIPEKIELNELARIPVRFNGRLTQLDAVARNYSRRFGDAVVFTDGEGNEYSALEWYLYLISDHAEINEGIRCLQISRGVCEQLEVPIEDGGRYSIKQILPVREKLSSAMDRIYRKDEKDLTAIEREMFELGSSLGTIGQLISAHRSPRELPMDSLAMELKFIDEFEGYSIPRMAMPLDRESGRWQVLFVSVFTDFARELVADQLDKDEAVPPNLYARSLAELLVAIKRSDAKAFSEHRKAVQTFLDEQSFGETALRFRPPEKWIEDGGERPHEFQFYSDAFTTGIPMARISRRGETDALITINHFPGKEIDPHLLCNSWRLSEGMSLLSREEFESLVPQTAKNGTAIWSVDLETPACIPKDKCKIFAKIIQHPSGTWTSTLYGEPEAVESELNTFGQFMDSISIPERVSKWIAPGTPQEVADEAMLGILVGGDTVNWLVRVSGDSNAIGHAREEIIGAVKSLQEIPSVADATNFEQLTGWKAPEKWDEISSGQGHQRIYFLPLEELNDSLLIDLTVVQPIGDGQRAALVNYLRASRQLAPLSAEAIEKELDTNNSGEWIEIPIGF